MQKLASPEMAMIDKFTVSGIRLTH